MTHNLWVWNYNEFSDFFEIDVSLVEIYKAILKLNKGSSVVTRQSTRRRTTRSERSDNYLPIRWQFGHFVQKNAFYSESRRLLRTCSDIGHQICPSSRSGNSFAFSLVITVNSIQTPASNREEEGTYISYD